ALGLFTLMTAFYAIGKILSNAILTEKKVELVDELETRVDEDMLTGSFDDNSLGDTLRLVVVVFASLQLQIINFL
ncbi:type II secretion system protein, partial [Francisella tularensis subsp. holarctica]|uniref:type II secretion system protein n=1 Tax=Francisella tularensis TaxID=263 RepID=UPI0023819D86